jgi:hypothetical protein
MSTNKDWDELIDRHLRGELDEPEKERLAVLLDSNSAMREEFVEQVQWDVRFSELLRGSPEGEDSSELETLVKDVMGERTMRELKQRERPSPSTLTRTSLAVALVAIVTLGAGLYFERAKSAKRILAMPALSKAENKIAKITGLSGPLLWIGSGGQVRRSLSMGTELPGGTIEGMAPDSWFELEFKDRTSVVISGNSVLTFSDDGQKKLHLKEGAFSADVQPQPAGKPMLLQTRTASLQILGTQFRVDAEPFSTTLNVSSGKVRIKRLSDGSKVEVPAGYRVVAAPDHQMSLTPVPASTSAWTSHLQLGAGGSLGRWQAPTARRRARLLAAPFTTEDEKTIFVAALGVTHGDTPPVVLHSGSTLRVRGHIRSAHPVWFGVTVRQTNGDFAGRFQIIRKVDESQIRDGFDFTLRLDDYVLDPSLRKEKDRLPGEPAGLVVESFWCHTLWDPVGLSITEIELIPPAEMGDENIRPGKVEP